MISEISLRHPRRGGASRRAAAPRVVQAALAALLLAAMPGAGSANAARGEPESAMADFSLGVRVGLCIAQHTGSEERDSDYDVDSEWRTGSAAGLFVYWPITPRFGLQQELLYSQKGSHQTIGVEILEIPTVLDVTYEMDYIEIPVLMRFTWFSSGRTSFYSLMGTAFSLKISDRYVLEGELDDGQQVVPIHADSDMSEVDMFDYSFVYGLGYEFAFDAVHFLVEYRFTAGWNTLSMPTYAYIPFDDEEILIENEPVPLKNQSHSVSLGIRF